MGVAPVKVRALWVVAFASVIVLIDCANVRKHVSIEESIREDPDLSEFYSLVERDISANNTIMYRQCTLFAPTNRAFQRHPELKVKASVHYHLANVAATLDQLDKIITSDFDSNPPLYITRKKVNGKEEIYINNARVIRSRSNKIGHNVKGKRTVLHVIDDILEPVLIKSSASLDMQTSYPDAHQFLAHSENMEIGNFRLRTFRSRVDMQKRNILFQAPGLHTFFIPVEEGFKSIHRPDLIDRRVIDGHVIPDRVIFTAPAPLDEPLNTAAMEDNMKVQISFFSQGEGHHRKTYVKSQTLGSDGMHTQGVVLGEIVKANIPVRNGVVHLIHRPLVIVDTTVVQLLEEKDDGPLNKFWEAINDFDPEFVNRMRNMKDLTVFAPSNEAWNDPNLQNIIRNRHRMAEILSLHLVRDRLNTEKIKNNNVNQISQVQTAADRRYLYFNIQGGLGRNQTVTVEGGGVNATIFQADIAATNGYIHMIDKVLGVPYTTMLQKLQSDATLGMTFDMGARTQFNSLLDDRQTRFTYFVPRDKAWLNSENLYPHALPKLKSAEYDVETMDLLKRHIIKSDKAFTMSDLRVFKNETAEIATLNGILRIRVKEEDKRYSILFNNRWIQVHRPDVECTNGIIHVIDFPLLLDSDVVVNGAHMIDVLKHLILMAVVARFLL